jgi:hypothetical protein
MITLRFIDDHTKTFGRTFRYRTIAGARTKAHQLVGLNPKRDPDGYVSHRTTGNCLFFQGCTYEELFLNDTQKAFLETLDPSPERWTEVLTEEHVTAAALERRGVIVVRRNDPHWEARRS